MSDTDSESTDSDNNNLSPLFNHYIGRPFGLQEHEDLQVDDSSSSSLDSSPQFDDLASSSTSDNDVVLNFTSESDDYLSEPDNMSNSTGTSTIFEPLINEFNSGQISLPIPKHNNNWCIPRELFNREIGNYKYHGTWNNKFYQSLVAVQKLKLTRQLKGHEGCVNSLDFNKTGDMLVSGSDDCRICLWNWSTGKCLLKYRSIHYRNIFQTKFLTTHDRGDDLRIVSSGRDGLVILTGMHNGVVNFSKTIARHDRSCNKVCVHPDLPYVVLSCGEDGVVKNIDIRESPIDENERISNILNIKNSNGSTMRLYGIDINPMKPFEFIVNGDDEYVRMYDKRNPSTVPVEIFHRVLATFKATDDENDDDSRSVSSYTNELHITSALYNYCGTEILASYSEEDIYLFDVNSSPGSYLHRYSGHLNRATVKGVNFYGPRSDYVISGSDCGHIFMWDKKSEAIVLRKHADGKGVVNVLEAHPCVPTLATSGLDKTIKIWEPVRKWQQPDKENLRLCVVKHREERQRRRRSSTPLGNMSVGSAYRQFDVFF